MKKIIVMTIALLCASPFGGWGAGAWAQDANIITISTLDGLKAFMADVHNNNYQGMTVKLAKDIDCEGGRFNTGDPVNPSTFAGTFDGQEHKIFNFVNTPTGSGDYGYGTAMFDFAEAGATIKDLTLEGTLPGTYSSAYSAAFVLAVESPLGLQLDDCHFNGSVTNDYHSAALVGFASPGSDPNYKDTPSVVLNNCTANATITTTGEFTVGGLVTKGTNVQAENCSFTGTINGKWTMGGLIGEAVNCTFTDCSFSGSMGAGPGASTSTLSNGGCGGLVGYSDGSIFSGCTATVDINWDINNGTERTNSNNFIGEGGAVGVTLGASQFINCSATGKLVAAHGYAGGFVGWTAGAETFDGCTTDVTINAAASHTSTIGNGGFAACVASNGATFKDCTTSSLGKDIYGGFYNVQHPKSGVTVGANTFLRCTVNNVSVFGEGNNANTGGFCVNAWKGTFTDCTVRGGEPEAGFVLIAGKKPSSEYEDVQTSTFTHCAVIGATVTTGFVRISNPDKSSTNINTFSGCRAACTYNNLCNGSSYDGFAHILETKTTVVDCAAYGAQAGGSDELYGFAYQILPGATVSRCVGAVLPIACQTGGAGFAGTISYDTTVQDCYSVYGPRSSAVDVNGGKGGFVQRTDIGYKEGDLLIARCIALWPLPEPISGKESCGSFCGITPFSSTDRCFEDCYRPNESPIEDFNNHDHPGVAGLTKAEFATATAATMPNYDFADTWHSPNGVASSPYLNASTDANGDFWTYATVIGGKGHILINGEAPRESYPAGSFLTVQVVPDDVNTPFTGWVGDGFQDPTALTTTYTVKNVSAIAATFGFNLANNADNTDVITAADGKTCNVILQGRTLYKDGDWNTLCLPFDLPIPGSVLDDEGVDVRTLSGSSFADGELTLNFTPAPEEDGAVTMIEAGTPYLIRWAKPDGYEGHESKYDLASPAFIGVPIDKTKHDVAFTLDETEGQEKSMIFCGNYAPVNLGANDNKKLYLGSNNKLYYPSTAMTINAQRAYFQLDGIEAGDVATTRLFFGDEHSQTNIGHTEITEITEKADAWFTLDGRKLSGKPTTKGLYINNGKKVVIKWVK